MEQRIKARAKAALDALKRYDWEKYQEDAGWLHGVEQALEEALRRQHESTRQLLSLVESSRADISSGMLEQLGRQRRA